MTRAAEVAATTGKGDRHGRSVDRPAAQVPLGRRGGPAGRRGHRRRGARRHALEEVVARLRGLLRRAGAAAARDGALLVVGDLTMDEDSREVRRGDELVELTATEFELLRFLMRNPRRVLSKAQILDRVWHYDFGGQVNVVELYVSYLRKKIDVGRPPMIHTVRGAGYVLKPAG
ncbi:MAG TPA: winged helix-turn-helix domain-containing protein [Frankiaceae bacterium]|nr:winged helix-turn-helix domain-containing protein [Frankiaceae bacterium]